MGYCSECLPNLRRGFYHCSDTLSCKNVKECGSCTTEIEFEFTTWAWVQATAQCCSGGGQPSFFYLLTYVNECKWVDHDEFWVDWVYCFYGPGDGTRKPLPIAVPAVAWTQAQVVNSNSTSSGKETPKSKFCARKFTRKFVIFCRRVDRDNFVRIMWNDVGNYLDQFDRAQGTIINPCPYDYSSVMHYAPKVRHYHHTLPHDYSSVMHYAPKVRHYHHTLPHEYSSVMHYAPKVRHYHHTLPHEYSSVMHYAPKVRHYHHTLPHEYSSVMHYAPKVRHYHHTLPHDYSSVMHYAPKVRHYHHTLPHEYSSFMHYAPKVRHYHHTLPHEYSSVMHYAPKVRHYHHTLPHEYSSVMHYAPKVRHYHHTLPHEYSSVMHYAPKVRHNHHTLPLWLILCRALRTKSKSQSHHRTGRDLQYVV